MCKIVTASYNFTLIICSDLWNMVHNGTNIMLSTFGPTLTSLRHSCMMAYWTLGWTKPLTSFFRVTGDWPMSAMRARVRLTTSGCVQGAGTSSTNGIRYGGFTWRGNMDWCLRAVSTLRLHSLSYFIQSA